MTNDIEAAARAAARHALEAVGVRPNNADDFDEIVDNAARSAIAHAARGEGEVDRLARFIMENIPGEPSKSEGAVDCAIRLLSRPTPPPATGEAGARRGR